MSINRNAAQASQFVVVSEQRKLPQSEQDVGTVEIKTYIFEPSTTIADVFKKLFENAKGFHWSNTLDRISIYPDENTVPEDEMITSVRDRRTDNKDPFGFDGISGVQDKGK
ncbi:hypothetical protein EYE42_01660 [Paracoccus subflavus]|uniref:Uncharacterized protein n=1 Tax=Paracoccus subflavus TaxID=2528244 RepID=A0A4V2JCT3_9RHOB|nr:hypothetical protein [Paracoccus subflavus]TBN43861.1 hypothetical protein EYE42_01660 [Paracoccus subflavus]